MEARARESAPAVPRAAFSRIAEEHSVADRLMRTSARERRLSSVGRWLSLPRLAQRRRSEESEAARVSLAAVQMLRLRRRHEGLDAAWGVGVAAGAGATVGACVRAEAVGRAALEERRISLKVAVCQTRQPGHRSRGLGKQRGRVLRERRFLGARARSRGAVGLRARFCVPTRFGVSALRRIQVKRAHEKRTKTRCA